MLRPGWRAGLAAIPRLVILSVLAGLLAAAVAVPLVGGIGVVTRDVAQTFQTLSVPHLGVLPSRSELLDSHGNLIAYIYPNGGSAGVINRVPVTYNQISPDMRNAIVAIEDSRFYQHGALDPKGTLRALVTNASHGATQGGSTLAQQYVKNALLLTGDQTANSRSFTRKIRELRMAAIVEHQLTKQQLLAAYLNVAWFENQAYGIQVAAERYFSTSAARLNLTQSAMLAGMVENQALYDPFVNPKTTLTRRNTVLARMSQVGYISKAGAKAAEAKPLGLNPSQTSFQGGCTSQSATNAAFFCDYVQRLLGASNASPAIKKINQELNTTGGLKIYTTLNRTDQRAADSAVNFVVPPRSGYYNPGGNVDTEVLVQPGTGKIKAIAVDRPFGNGRGQTTVDYAVGSHYGASEGVQTGSSSKLFTLLTALKQDTPFGFNLPYESPATIAGYYNCQGEYVQDYPNLFDAEGPGTKGIATLYNGTTQSINVFYAKLEQKVGLCNVVKTAVSLGVTRVDGKSLLQKDGVADAADNVTSFTLGTVNVSPLSMANAYATVAARGIYCSPIVITQAVTAAGSDLPVDSAHCHRVLSAEVADAASHILQGVLSSASGTASNRGIGVPAAAKTGTSDLGHYAAFAGYTPRLAGYVSVFNPNFPTTKDAMLGYRACFREVDGSLNCPAQMFGDNAPGATWQLTFQSLHLPYVNFVDVPSYSAFFSMGDGVNSPKPPAPPKTKRQANGNGGTPGPGVSNPPVITGPGKK